MTDTTPDRFWSGIDIPKTIAGVLAAVSAAVLGSFLGVAGTLVGAAVASIVGSVGTELYHRFINRGSQKIKQTFVTAPAAVGTPPVAAAEDEVPSEDATTVLPAVSPETPKPAARVRWGRIAAVAGAVFVLAMGALTAFELITKQTVADAVGGSSGGRTTTVGNVLSGNGGDETEQPATTPSGSPSPTATSETEPTGEPTTEPTDGATTEPAPTGTTSPSPDEPTTTGEPTDETDQPGADQPGDPGAPADDGQG